MSLVSQIQAAFASVAADIKTLKGNVGESLLFSKSGTLTVGTGVSRVPIHAGTYSIASVAAMVNTAPTGAAIIVDVKKNGVTIYSTSANRPTVAINGTSAVVGAHSTTSVTSGDYLTVDVVQVGSTVAGADLVVSVRLKRTGA